MTNTETTTALSAAEAAIEANDLHAARVILSHVSINDVIGTREGVTRLRTLNRRSRGHRD